MMHLAIPSSTVTLTDSVNARFRRILTSLSTFATPQALEAAEAEIIATQDELRQLRLHVRQIRASARTSRRAAA